MNNLIINRNKKKKKNFKIFRKRDRAEPGLLLGPLERLAPPVLPAEPPPPSPSPDDDRLSPPPSPSPAGHALELREHAAAAPALDVIDRLQQSTAATDQRGQLSPRRGPLLPVSRRLL